MYPPCSYTGVCAVFRLGSCPAGATSTQVEIPFAFGWGFLRRPSTLIQRYDHLTDCNRISLRDVNLRDVPDAVDGGWERSPSHFPTQ